MTAAATATEPTTVWPARWLALGGLVLVGATWPLWTGTSPFPQVPFLAGLRTVPLAADWFLLAVLLAAWIVTLLKPAPDRIGRGALLVASVALAALILLNQHRLQPWAWEFLLVGVLLATAAPPVALAGWRWLVVSIYAWSALSKLDITFFQSHGPFLLEGLFRALGRPDVLELWSAAARTRLAAAIPVSELLIALLLAVRSTRMLGLIGATSMHLVLLLALGPLGHGHQPGVLLWNVFFIGQNLLLFARPAGPCPAWRDASAATRFAGSVAGLAMILPALEPFGLWDHWPGWAVYASRPERLFVSVAESDAPQLPAHVRQWLEPADPFDPWRQLRIDRWSLEAVRAPIYPQDRFAAGVALAVAAGPGGPEVRIIRESPADRFTGQRTVDVAVGTQAVADFVRRYRLNALPRSLTSRSVRNGAAAGRLPRPDR